MSSVTSPLSALLLLNAQKDSTLIIHWLLKFNMTKTKIMTFISALFILSALYLLRILTQAEYIRKTETHSGHQVQQVSLWSSPLNLCSSGPAALPPPFSLLTAAAPSWACSLPLSIHPLYSRSFQIFLMIRINEGFRKL